MTTRQDLPTVAVLEANLPPALAFIRSLGSAGVPLRVYGSSRMTPGRFSRHTSHFDVAPDPANVDEFLAWLEVAVERDGIDLVAPTSDYIAFAASEFDDHHGTNLSGGIGGHRGAEAVRDCLFKDRFARRMEEVGFPIPSWSCPTTEDDALTEAERLGYPVVLKPKSHIGVGVQRGYVVRSPEELRERFHPFEVDASRVEALADRRGFDGPLMQTMITGRDMRVDSVSGYVGFDGNVHGLEFNTKLSQWGDELGIGTLFSTIPRPAYADQALSAVRALLPRGIFEFEVLVDLASGQHWAIELNPRGFGQMSLNIARGSDLPKYWYADAIGADPPPRSRSTMNLPTQWRLGIPYFAGAVLDIAVGPRRLTTGRRLLNSVRTPTAAAMHSWLDPIPGALFTAMLLRHPGGLVRPFLRTR